MKGFRLPNWYLYFFIFVFAALLILEILQYSNILKFYPLHIVTDLNTYMLRLHFLRDIGFHNLVPHVGGGVFLYYGYPIGWGFFNLLTYILTDNILLTTFLSTIIFFVLSFIFIYLTGKIEGFPFVKSLAFFFMFFACPLMLISIFFIGRGSEHIGWMVFTLFFLFIWLYKNRKFDWKGFVFFVLIYSILLLTHIYLFIVGTILLAGLFLVKSNLSRLKIIFGGILTLILTSFWWVKFNEYAQSVPHKWSIQNELITSGFFSSHIWLSYSTFSLVLFFIVFFLFHRFVKNYNAGKNYWQEMVFYFPVFVFAILVFTKLIIFIPVFSSLPFNIYSEFFIFVSIFTFLRIKKFYLPKIKGLALIVLILIPFLVGGFYVYNYHEGDLFYEYPYEYTEQDADVLELVADIEGKFIFLTDVIVADPVTNLHLDWPYTYYSIIFHDKETISPIYSWVLKNPEIKMNIEELLLSYNDGDCERVVEKLDEMGYGSVMSYDPYCVRVEACGLEVSKRIGVACLFYLEND